ncbi:class I SAM-dependent methyltransferase [Alicyclobacillus acidoterrestris]|uniref:Class I SAM-dependent methyltransferase n=1 Tax=Alicyclobacillus acidoterrestris (strain ATCC 49025 / DSM 3922 / CIP 106132 / NCIMB 13137 / GD3B) TaxID=1356854 RepID=T0CNI7_ALIAG|nr:class I SAM-dependent methyltransferase [Alicyclobacillus acidoterrestris]EPZ41022.1 hypothetical protein N007_17505 [Alicyclobacillus acidoterrestris ATCC 49025]UNO47814.1 class I SAM-dependent methyltransferase [Alicyclobacillus acidoterrestris]GEO27182.1 hypothetical protein AAC03nite_29670 [Alicyclobacillus acidoterrestris]
MSERDRGLKLDSEQESWNEKYRRREETLFAPDAFLVARRHQLQEGTILDVACGDGRNALYLARHGFTVTGVDFSREALRRLAHFSQAQGLTVEAHQLSLEQGALRAVGRFDNVIVVHFKPSPETFRDIGDVLNEGGILLMTSFNLRQHVERNFPEKYCYREREFIGVDDRLELLEYTSYQNERGHFDGYVFRKK